MHCKRRKEKMPGPIEYTKPIPVFLYSKLYREVNSTKILIPYFLALLPIVPEERSWASVMKYLG